MNNLPVDGSMGSLPLINALNSEMGATCPVTGSGSAGNLALLPPGTITMTTYNGTLSPAGSLYGNG
jgi:hypothetical protein